MQDAFEELCCQLAAGESPAEGARFIRKGTPDAGVECFWILPNGDEHAWQAKYFLSTPNAHQWKQVDDSVKTALKQHPRITKYIICMPFDRPDARVTGHKSSLDRWDERVAKWKKLARAKDKNRSVEFEFWGNHELTKLLSLKKNRGRFWFWFESEEFTQEWFSNKLEESIANAGDRYTPELNVELPISKSFEALGRTPEFHKRVGDLYQSMREEVSRLSREAIRNEITTIKKSLQELPDIVFDKISAKIDHIQNEMRGSVEVVFNLLDNVLLPLDVDTYTSVRPIPWNQLEDLLQKILKQINNLRDTVQRMASEHSLAKQQKSGELDEYHRMILLPFMNRIDYAERASSDLLKFCSVEEAMLANQPGLLLVGEAGQGKTHLLCDVASRDLKAGWPRLLFHGSHFRDADPFSQIISLLGLNCTTAEFLGALEAAGQDYNSRVLILIDALNEGEGRSLWEKHLAGMLPQIYQHPWLGIALSVRDYYYENMVIPKKLVSEQRLTRVIHNGFQEQEHKAVQRFFSYFKIQATGPLLVPEFSNPLYLMLYCKTVNPKRKEFTQMPPGIRGITALLNAFLDAVNDRLSEKGFDPKDNLGHKAADEIAALIAESGNYNLPRAQVKTKLNQLCPTPPNEYPRSLLCKLVAEDLFSESRLPIGSEVQEVVHFTYERFADHLLATHYLDKNKDSLKKAFGPRTSLGKMLRGKAESSEYAGLKEALSIQLPERFKLELVDLVPELKQQESTQLAFLRSLVWRDASSFPKAMFEYLDSLRKFPHLQAEVLNSLLAVAPIPNHPLNADYLHEHLLKSPMPERDSWWSVFISRDGEKNRAVNRLIDWAWEDTDKSAVSEEVVLLTGIPLTWFLSSMSPIVRDRATKALVRLFDNRLLVLTKLIHRFREVNDPYVSERLVAVAYGCALRASKIAGLKELAEMVADVVFGKNGFQPNLLTRDYGRGVIDVARHCKAVLPNAHPKAYPPYGSKCPELRISSTKKNQKKGKHRVVDPEKEQSRKIIHLLATDRHYSKFGKRYVIGHYPFNEWTKVHVKKSTPKTSNAPYEEFLSHLSQRQRKLFDIYIDAFQEAEDIRQLSLEERAAQGQDCTDQQIEEMVHTAEADFLQSLHGKENLLKKFQEFIKPYVEHPMRYKEGTPIDIDEATRWLVQRVLEFGWTHERFGWFDDDIIGIDPTHDLIGPSKPSFSDPTGEKYLWIAYRELLARLADNYHVRKRHGTKQELLVVCRGFWDLESGSRDDVDPSVVIRSTKNENSADGHSLCWWSPVAVTDWQRELDDATWIESKDDLPCPKAMLSVSRQDRSDSWYVLDTDVVWMQPSSLGCKNYDLPRRRLWYQLRSYLVKKNQADSFFRGAKRQLLKNSWMPNPFVVRDVAHGEFYWSPEYKAWKSKEGTEWQEVGLKDMSYEVLLTAIAYSQESQGADRSLDDSLLFSIPTQELVEGMALRWSGVEGTFIDQQGKLAAFDPSIDESGPSALLVRADLLKKYLNDNGLELFWMLRGEKNLPGGRSRSAAPGRLEIEGVYRLTPKGIVGSRIAEYRK